MDGPIGMPEEMDATWPQSGRCSRPVTRSPLSVVMPPTTQWFAGRSLLARTVPSETVVPFGYAGRGWTSQDLPHRMSAT